MKLYKKHNTRAPLFMTLGAAFVLCAGVFAFLVLVPHPTGIKNVTVDGLPAASLPAKLELPKDKLAQTFTSPELKADFAFNAIVPVWDGDGNGEIQMRTADSSGTWTDWMSVEGNGEALRPGAKTIAQHYPETPIIVDGQQYQYRVKLSRSAADSASPTITNLKITYIDSHQSALEKVSAAAKSLFNHKAMAGNSPPVNTRAEWGSPDPNGDLFKGTDKYWSPEYRPVTQVFVHLSLIHI